MSLVLLFECTNVINLTKAVGTKNTMVNYIIIKLTFLIDGVFNGAKRLKSFNKTRTPVILIFISI